MGYILLIWGCMFFFQRRAPTNFNGSKAHNILVVAQGKFVSLRPDGENHLVYILLGTEKTDSNRYNLLWKNFPLPSKHIPNFVDDVTMTGYMYE